MQMQQQAREESKKNYMIMSKPGWNDSCDQVTIGSVLHLIGCKSGASS